VGHVGVIGHFRGMGLVGLHSPDDEFMIEFPGVAQKELHLLAVGDLDRLWRERHTLLGLAHGDLDDAPTLGWITGAPVGRLGMVIVCVVPRVSPGSGDSEQGKRGNCDEVQGNTHDPLLQWWP
jgi:hypothetical protein